MEPIQDRPVTEEEEEFPEEFQCCVCLDIMYKPVVLACGHISCFWCTYKAMNTCIESHCPVCRNPYNHFPRICGLLHFVLMKLYPVAYKIKAGHVAEEEKEYGHESPQFDDSFIESQFSEVDGVQDATNIVSSQPTESSQTPTSEANSIVKSTGKILATQLQCAVCKQLLYRPAVLNCGHVYCESCIHPDDNVYKCLVCQSAHPNGISNVCLILHHFLEEYFPEEYLARKESLAHCQSPSGSLPEKPEQTAKASSEQSGRRVNFHPFVGCDNCGMCPIVGLRYRCIDCVESIGFDLCEDCYKSSSKLPGRFNQQHTEDHQFEVLQSSHLQMLLSSLGAELSTEDDESGSGPEENDGIA